MSNKLEDVKEYLLNGESFSKDDIINDMLIETFRQMYGKVEHDTPLSADEISLHWGDQYITDLEGFLSHFYRFLMIKVGNTIDSFK
ncbi:hypothetical protein AF332_11780 [Sporosarcina globispora]|uniref:Uncharacterized protein n=1 Tax=Sporosarcina globispora TaxID=1459 RepID=A0A0M0GC89_SPOGL|nr:hypothetical protein [Sporosarcina globispora]KON87439.1 hypothetical protein AF332_11780 [Sporosarcina globispora]